MGTTTGTPNMERFDKLTAQIATHEGAIGALGNRIGHVEKTLVDHGTILHTIEKAVTKQDLKPTINPHTTVQTILALAILFSMVVGGIIWVTSSQFSPLTQTVERNEARISKVEGDVADIKEKSSWLARIDKR